MRVHLLNFDDVYEALASAKHYDALWNRFVEFMTESGIDLINYHHITPPSSIDKHRIDILSYGYPRAWKQYYDDNKLYKHDPIFNTAYKTLRPLKWSEALKQDGLTSEEKALISEFKEWMKGDGYSIPVFGPSGKNGCFGLGNMATIFDWDRSALRQVEWICSQFHLAYCVLRLKEFPQTLSLTDQDRSILQQWAKDTNVVMIAESLGQDAKTVRNTLNEIMEKMNVTDGPSLLIRAAHLGIIKPRP